MHINAGQVYRIHTKISVYKYAPVATERPIAVEPAGRDCN
jgi:hypothetical protein